MEIKDFLLIHEVKAERFWILREGSEITWYLEGGPEGGSEKASKKLFVLYLKRYSLFLSGLKKHYVISGRSLGV